MDYKPNRTPIRGDLWQEFKTLELDQRNGLPTPPVEKPFAETAPTFDLIPPQELRLGQMPLIDAIRSRASRRTYTSDPLTIEELSFLLWATQGVREIFREGTMIRRTVPSGGSRHPFETYLAVINVEGLAPGLYRYLSLRHQLGLLCEDPAMGEHLANACCDFAGKSAVTFIWTAIPYRTEWRYGPLAAKLIAQDSGHVCQNLYLACAAIGAGTCAVGAYNQAAMDALLGVDGEDEFTFYAAPVGKLP